MEDIKALVISIAGSIAGTIILNAILNHKKKP